MKKQNIASKTATKRPVRVAIHQLPTGVRGLDEILGGWDPGVLPEHDRRLAWLMRHVEIARRAQETETAPEPKSISIAKPRK